MGTDFKPVPILLLLHHQMVIGSIDQQRQIVARSAVVLQDGDIFPGGARLGPVRIHGDGDVAAVLRHLHEVVDIAAGIEIPIEQRMVMMLLPVSMTSA